MKLIRGKQPEVTIDPARTLHPSISPEVIAHLRAHGYIVTDPTDLAGLIERMVEANRHRTSADIARRIVNRLRRGNDLDH